MPNTKVDSSYNYGERSLSVVHHLARSDVSHDSISVNASTSPKASYYDVCT